MEKLPVRSEREAVRQPDGQGLDHTGHIFAVLPLEIFPEVAAQQDRCLMLRQSAHRGIGLEGGLHARQGQLGVGAVQGGGGVQMVQLVCQAPVFQGAV